MKATKLAAEMGARILMKVRCFRERSTSGEAMAAATRPTRMSRAPAMPDSVSEKPYGVRIWVRREARELKRPT